MHRDAFGEHWDRKYPKISQSWRDNWANLSTYFKYPQEGTDVGCFCYFGVCGISTFFTEHAVLLPRPPSCAIAL